MADQITSDKVVQVIVLEYSTFGLIASSMRGLLLDQRDDHIWNYIWDINRQFFIRVNYKAIEVHQHIYFWSWLRQPQVNASAELHRCNDDNPKVGVSSLHARVQTQD